MNMLCLLGLHNNKGEIVIQPSIDAPFITKTAHKTKCQRCLKWSEWTTWYYGRALKTIFRKGRG